MFCPVCSQEQISGETRFCSRCGFLLTGISQVIANGGVLPYAQETEGSNALSPRKKGIKQGALMFFLSLVIVPLIAIFTMFVHARPFAVFAAIFLLTVGGILRMLYALLFESNHPGMADESALPDALKNFLPNKNQSPALPPQQSIQASSYVPPPPAGAAGKWQTNDLTAPPSVTEPTTNLLHKEP